LSLSSRLIGVKLEFQSLKNVNCDICVICLAILTKIHLSFHTISSSISFSAFIHNIISLFSLEPVQLLWDAALIMALENIIYLLLINDNFFIDLFYFRLATSRFSIK